MQTKRKNVKFIQIVSREIFQTLSAIAKDRGVGLQELIRGVVIPDWLQGNYTKGEILRFRKRRRTLARLKPAKQTVSTFLKRR